VIRIVVASIPSPSQGILHLGPVPLHIYGLCLAVGVIAATKVTEVRWRQRGHDPKEIADIAVWLVVGGVIGARLYHVVTDYQLYTDDWLNALRIWTGGLGIWGAVAGGVVAAVLVARRRKLDTLALLDAGGPGVVLAQAIGRWGNYFNQELFGRPTTLPWAVEIDPVHRPVGYRQYATFHPTFLYESLWCLTVFAVLIWVDRRFRLRRGQVFALYIALYTFARFFFENMRIDSAHRIAGLRVNAWVSVALFAGSVIWFVVLGRRPMAGEPAEPVEASPPGA
jgi:prolipoprotein diacylglyceryl transferase